ncbi:MAG: poly-beta-1,6-N-acetyl-D-glucosamine N-deacetylase PgaB [Nitrospinota bacterium]
MNIKIIIIILISLLIIPVTNPADPDTASPSPDISPPIHAAQVPTFQCKTLYEVENKIKEMKRSGVDTIIVRVFQNDGDRFYSFADRNNRVGVYFKTPHAPLVDDILGDLVEIAHRNRMKIFAWMTTRRCDWKIYERPDLRGYKYDIESGGIIPTNGLNIFNKEVQRYLRDIYIDLAAYDIDGILFQDDLILRHTEGYSQEAVNLYMTESGHRVNPNDMFRGIYEKSGKYFVSYYTPKFWIWAKWKNRQILNLVEAMMGSARSVNPDLKFALNLYYETITDPKNALAWLSQDMNAALKCNFDYYSLMAYHRQIKKELQLSNKELYIFLKDMTTKMIDLIDNPNKILMKVQVVDWDTNIPIPHREIDKVFESITSQGRVSLAFTPVTKYLPLKVIRKYYLP